VLLTRACQNGGYLNPPMIKRQFRDPYADWWDKQERRNFGEPVHEDDDILGMFSLYEYTHMTPARGALIWGILASVVLGGVYTASIYYPDRPSAPKEYDGGLDTELGGPGSVRVSKHDSNVF
jgi:NADH dehydrogenase (ubiquinone) 1 beta subcomplex subunit 8